MAKYMLDRDSALGPTFRRNLFRRWCGWDSAEVGPEKGFAGQRFRSRGSGVWRSVRGRGAVDSVNGSRIAWGLERFSWGGSPGFASLIRGAFRDVGRRSPTMRSTNTGSSMTGGSPLTWLVVSARIVA